LALLLASLPKVTRRVRGSAIRLIIRAAGGECGSGLQVERGFRVRRGFHEGIRIGRSVYIGKDVTIDCTHGGSLDIGANVTLTHGIFISCVESVSIGNDALIGEYSSIRDANHGIGPDELIRNQPLTSSPVNIGRDVWVGRGVAVLPGTSIGDGAVVGANAVVTRKVANGQIVAGVPARQIGLRSALPLRDDKAAA
jgi:acetyltransferase-like isoleucine patch superfamily enzyme